MDRINLTWLGYQKKKRHEVEEELRVHGESRKGEIGDTHFIIHMCDKIFKSKENIF